MDRTVQKAPPAKGEPAAPRQPAPRKAPRDGGYGRSHGYGPAHGGPSGPGDCPGDEALPAPSMDDEDEDTADEPVTRPSER